MFYITAKQVMRLHNVTIFNTTFKFGINVNAKTLSLAFEMACKNDHADIADIITKTLATAFEMACKSDVSLLRVLASAAERQGDEWR